MSEQEKNQNETAELIKKEDKWFAVKIIASAPTARALRKVVAQGGEFETVLRGKKFGLKKQTKVTF